jgi:hypothetical protein
MYMYVVHVHERAETTCLEVEVQVVVPGHSFPHAGEDGAVVVGLDADVHVSRHLGEL